MNRSNSRRNREGVARAIVAMDEIWIELFSDLGLGDLSYCDLLIHMWLRRDRILHKTDLYAFMPSVSRRTAVKYVQRVIEGGLLEERAMEDDKRVRQVALTATLVERLERFYDLTSEQFFGSA
ncbi:hypothetical protein [Stutzerimonas azotifigens]|uniref:hypothetical protein n=1 Tax=Stutzerimonas azotifigens TaxID=291995 RepID=UPI00040B65AE|nr:hypothetical protein [Stutzerimonas azotifigens]